jgi:hypothetical protein
MKLGLKTIVLALVVALLCVPAAFAKGHEGGNGHGKPSWAGGGGHGKPAWAGHGKGHADTAKAKHEKVKHQKAGSEDAAALEGELNLDDLNPAWYCKTLESMMDTADADATAGGAEPGDFSSFDSEFGTNDNKRNSFGKCVSARAQGEDLSGALGDQEQSCDQTADDGTDTSATDEGTDTSATDEGTDTSATDEGTDTSATDEGTDTSAADDPADDGSGDQADQADDCQSDDSSGEDNQDDQAGEGDQDEDTDAQDNEDDQGAEAEVAAFARALVRFIRL